MTALRLIPQNVDYSDKDFDSIRARLFQLVRSVFPAWTDESVANFGNILVELNAFVGDVLTFYQDNQARESRIATAKLRRSLLGLVKLIGYVPSGASASTADVTLTLNEPIAAGDSLTIPKGDRAATLEITSPIFYQFLDDVVFDEGEVSKTVSVEQSAFQSAQVVSTGLANAAFVLPVTPFLDDSATAVFSNGTFTQVNNFLASTATDRHFVVTVDQNDRATLRFGNGVSGVIPIGTGTVTYKTGGGRAGRVEAGALKRMEKTYLTALGDAVNVAVTNANASAGGEDRETNAQIRVNAPESLRVLGRAIAREDFEIAAQQVDGVARSLHVTSNEYDAVPENTGYLFVVPAGGGIPSQLMLDAVAAQFSNTGPYPKGNTYNLIVQAPSYQTINIDAIIYPARGYTPAQAAAAVRLALSDYFAIQNDDDTPNDQINFGYYFQDEEGEPTGTLDWSTIFNVIRDVAEVRKIDPGDEGLLLNGQRDDIEIGVIGFPQLGTVGLRDGSTGAVI